MYGRYGTDQLNLFLLICAFSISVISNFIPIPFFGYLGLIPLIYSIYRTFSKNIAKRRSENEKFLHVWRKFTRFFKNFKKNAADRKIYKYFKCPNCSQKVRVPKGKGKISITCPKCKTKFIKTT